jgi:hypothetical protein
MDVGRRAGDDRDVSFELAETIAKEGQRMSPHDCPDCGRFYAPRHAREADRCWSCAGMTIHEHLAAINGERDEFVRGRVTVLGEGRSNGQAGASARPAYLRRIDELLG